MQATAAISAPVGNDTPWQTAEQQVREDLAAAYRLMAHFGMDEIDQRIYPRVVEIINSAK